MERYDVIIAGVTGNVGQMLLQILEEYEFPIGRLKLLASRRSAGKVIAFKGQDHVVEELGGDSFDGYQLAFFCAGGSVSKEYAPIARSKGLVVIDNSSVWRQDPAIGLVVPEVNFEAAAKDPIVANPNCSTIQCMLPLAALNSAYGLKSVSYTTYQAVSGSGQGGCADLAVTREGGAPAFYPHNISETAIPEIDAFLENGYTKEEMKMVWETRKILDLPELPVSATCIRVPVMNGHGVNVVVELSAAFEVSNVLKVLSEAEGIAVLNNGPAHEYPTSTIANGTDLVYVGRIRKDLAHPQRLLFYCVADNIRKGAATNAVQIALKMLSAGLLPESREGAASC